jgi:hypothetical protein
MNHGASKIRLNLSAHQFRVTKGDEILGQFSNQTLAEETAYLNRAAVVDMSTTPPMVVYKDGKRIEASAGPIRR